MIITRTPFRISFFGGGTDYPVWYEKNGGAVLSTTINKYCYISCRYLPPFFDYKYRIRYSLREEVGRLAQIRHPAVREALRYLSIKKGIEMVHTSDLPAQSGIGSSSAFTVGFLNALYALAGRITTKRQIALDAIHLEQDIIREHVGSQDQVAVAFGGLNRISFGGPKQIYVQPVTIGRERLRLLEGRLMLFFTGFSRNASEIAGEQIRETPGKNRELKAIQDSVDEAISVLNGRSSRIDDFGKLLHECWRIKKSLSTLISTGKIDAIYEEARRCGALGGKLLGAGGGGFMLFFARPKDQARIRRRLKRLLYVPFCFESLGSQVVFYSPQESWGER